MYDNVIVPFDSSLELRAALAPAADLAWRCRAKIVVVNTTPAADEESRLVLKSQAISMSGADVDFWVDLDVGVGDALVEAARHRAHPILCVASRYRKSGLLRRRRSIPPPRQVFTEIDAPVLVIGPEADVSRGLNMVEVLVLDDGAASADALALAARWGQGLRVDVRVVSVVSTTDHDTMAQVQQRFDALVAEVPGASLEVLASDRPAATMVAVAGRRPDAVVMVGRGVPSAGSPVGPVAAELIATSPRFVVVAGAGPGDQAAVF
ncbi:hypothetical protein [Rhabdothermincola salaria]|uniref:hypothetical protein n=1 Tax=Rhabdothermincola salaria TaxID=2903142 RepID=UPI001E5F7381|nr:hypothetical protein [Rhabdothermincola salaria]MCD9623839.1 hypothetical protein [Rhabdothermincola salaria]